ncbi:hypothetical protein BDL97_19G034200 [Sphagnum fallax]|nr:hypothetical protein BDL97_19G034200 [Sphagnum fallax]
MEASRKFTLDASSEGAAKLKAIVKAKLSEFIGNYSDDVLVEYVVVLVSHGKQPSQAIVDLEAFLGNESKAFVTWLWDHLTTHQDLYMGTKEEKHLHMDTDEDKQLATDTKQETKPQNGRGGRTIASVVAVNEGAAAVVHTEDEDGLATFEGTRSESRPEVGRYSTRRGQHREKSLHSEKKRARSPEIWTRKGRGRPDMIEMSPPDVKASRRLLISAVREAVAESARLASTRSAMLKAESGSKHLPSAVSPDVDVQGPDLEVVHADAFMQDMQIPEVFQETSEVQERPSSVWDRLGVQDNERPIRDEVFERVVRDNDRGEEETHKSFLNGARINSEYSEHRPRWTKGPERNNRNGSRRIYLGGMQQNFKFGLGENDQLPDATPNGLEQGLPLQVAIYSRNQIWLDRHPLQSYNPTYDTCGISPTNDNGMFAKRDFEQVDDGKAALYAQLNPNDVLEMKKRLRQVQLEMTKLRARQAEVSKEVQKTPVSGMRPLLFQPSQEDINSRSIFVSNVHFAATKAALAVHFGHCGEIVRVTLLADVATGKPKGSAYVEFSTKEAVKKALALNESSLLSRTLKVVRKDDAAVEMITPPIVHASMQRSHPPIAHPFSRDSVLRGKLHMLRRPAGIRKPFSGTSHLQWKREGSLTGASANDGVAMATGQRFGHGPVRLTRSLSYVRVAPYATH